MSLAARVFTKLFGDIKLFSKLVLRRPLRQYQLRPVKAVLASILNHQGLEFLAVFPRQSGKNEAASQLETYLINIFQRVGGNIIHGATGDALGMATERLESQLDNPWNADLWGKKRKPARRILGKAAVLFLSTHPSASARGQTSHWLTVIDEAQDQAGPHIEAVFTPMRAANNATVLYLGTVKLTTDYLWHKKNELEQEQAQDGVQRVYLVTPEEVCRENPAYRAFLDAQIRKHGRHHPIVASEYFLEPIDGAGGLFDGRRLALIKGTHLRQHEPSPAALYVATLDVAGQDEAATDPLAQLAHPGRDYTVATMFEIVPPACGALTRFPTYLAVDVFVDQGGRHFEDAPGRPKLVERLAAWLENWEIAHLVADESGVGQGVTSWLTAALGHHRVTGYQFSGTGKKAALGSALLSLIETGRFRYWTGDQDRPLSDGWWFWTQARACTYELPPDGRFDRDLRWGVPPNARIDTPAGSQLIHDDRLISAALITEIDRLYRQRKLVVGQAISAIIPAGDTLADLGF